MVAKVNIISAETAEALQVLVNAFLATLLAENVLDVDWGLTLVGRWHDSRVACFVTYQE